MKCALTSLTALLLVCGCSAPKPFLTLPAAQRESSRFSPCKDGGPELRFHTLGARDARNFGMMGGLVGVAVGLSVADSIEKDNPALKVIRATTGEFEKTMIEEQFRSRLPAELREAATDTNCHLQVCVRVVGLYEAERDRFAPFALATASLHSLNGKELWKAEARSIGRNPHSLETFGTQPDLYHKDFAEVAADLVTQLVEGPLREIKD